MPAISSAINATQASVAFTAALQRLPIASPPHTENDLKLEVRQTTTMTPGSTASSIFGNVLQSLSNISVVNTPANQLARTYAVSEEATGESSWPHEHHMGLKRSVSGRAVTTEPVFPSPPPSTSVFSTLSIESLVASSSEDLSGFRDVTFDLFDDEGDELFGSPLAFDASDNGLWNGRFVPPPPRPPFFVDEPILSDGLTTCDLCSWAMPTKSTFIFEGTIEKASELGWPLTLIIVSILSAVLGAIIMVTVVHCRRNKNTNNRNAQNGGRGVDIGFGLGTVIRSTGSLNSSSGSASASHYTYAHLHHPYCQGTPNTSVQDNISTSGPVGPSLALGLSARPASREALVSGSATLPLTMPSPIRDHHLYYHMPLQPHHYQYSGVGGGGAEPEYHQPQQLNLRPPPSAVAVERGGCHWSSATMIVAS